MTRTLRQPLARRCLLAAVLLGGAACAGAASDVPTPAAGPAPAPPASSAPPAAVEPSAAPAPPAATATPVFAVRRPTMVEAARQFDASGVQPGQRLPPLSLVDLAGQPADIAALQDGKPLVLVGCSLTCNVARRQQAAVTQLRERLGQRATVVMVYTVDAHPNVDASPYSGDMWVPPANEKDGVLVRQPSTLAERLALAGRYAQEWSKDTPVLVDTMDNVSWRVLGQAPNFGLLVDRSGMVVARCGWFDAAKIEAALPPP